MPLINCEVNLILTWPSTCVISYATGKTKFKIKDTKLYVSVVTLSIQDNAKLLQELKSGFKRTVNWKKYQSNIKTYTQNRYLNHLVDPSYQGVGRLFVLSFENEAGRTSHSTYYLPKAEIKDYNVMIDGKNFFDQPINSDFKTYENIRKIATGRGDDYMTCCLLDYSYCKDHSRMIAIDLSKKQVFDADSRAIQQINFTANLDRAGNTLMFFITEVEKETVFEVLRGIVKVF